MSHLLFRPLERWDRRGPATRPHSPFKAPYQATINLLEREARQLGAQRVIVELALRESDLRLDGQPYAGARTDHPGVTVAFDSRHGPLKYTADKFATWQENLRAIALGLEALRKVDRYGMTSRGEQYAGWKALPSGADSLRTRHPQANTGCCSATSTACGSSTPIGASRDPSRSCASPTTTPSSSACAP